MIDKLIALGGVAEAHAVPGEALEEAHTAAAADRPEPSREAAADLVEPPADPGPASAAAALYEMAILRPVVGGGAVADVSGRAGLAAQADCPFVPGGSDVRVRGIWP